MPSSIDAATSRIQRIIVDTDPGIDDAMALYFLRASAGIAIDRLTTVFGNAEVSVTTANAALLCRRFGAAPTNRWCVLAARARYMCMATMGWVTWASIGHGRRRSRRSPLPQPS